MKVSKRLQNVETVAQLIEEHGADGISIKQIISLDRTLSYGEVQAATITLRGRGHIKFERRSRTLYFFPT